MLASLVSNNSGNYSIQDNFPVYGINIYRLRQRDFTDNVTYSMNLKVDHKIFEPTVGNTNINSNATVYPNPASHSINIAMSNNIPAGKYNIAITNTWGLKVKEGHTSGPHWQSEVSDLRPGLYMVTITSNTDNKIIGYNKFLKN
ncbi:T9SS type A sorting domain-containing protein [Mucilaginibacter antarcticus]|uniref:T9SS type A sorting domain-containing protein n=1 Tax=Mucilaginibacter antarcticus TaxID=1855725 RepID=UPI00363EEA5D